jgi:hypothetical protein
MRSQGRPHRGRRHRRRASRILEFAFLSRIIASKPSVKGWRRGQRGPTRSTARSVARRRAKLRTGHKPAVEQGLSPYPIIAPIAEADDGVAAPDDARF